MDSSVLVLDNGAHSIRALWAVPGADVETVQTFRNAIATSKSSKRNYTANELDSCPDYGGLVFRLPFDKGILNNWATEKLIWDHVFGPNALDIEPSETKLFITEPVLNLPNVQDAYDQMLFEEYGFSSYLRCPGPAVIPFGTAAAGAGDVRPECVLVVDWGYSFAHITPVMKGAVIASGVRRIDIGGKLLTNHLKELISFRQLYMMDQTEVSQKLKEDCCYVSNQWAEDWEVANRSADNTIVQTYVLPDFDPTSTNKLGYVRPPPTGLTPPPPRLPTPPPVVPIPDIKGKGKAKAKAAVVVEEEQLLQMSNERFTVPEVIFHPSIIGLDQAGLPESIAHSIGSLPVELRGMFWSNIVCVGGSSGFPGFAQRLKSELRSLAPDEFLVDVRIDNSPAYSTVLSASAALLSNRRLGESFVSKTEYLESGPNAARRKFGKLYRTV